jgi:hypothetical protein
VARAQRVAMARNQNRRGSAMSMESADYGFSGVSPEVHHLPPRACVDVCVMSECVLREVQKERKTAFNRSHTSSISPMGQGTCVCTCVSGTTTCACVRSSSFYRRNALGRDLPTWPFVVSTSLVKGKSCWSPTGFTIMQQRSVTPAFATRWRS